MSDRSSDEIPPKPPDAEWSAHPGHPWWTDRQSRVVHDDHSELEYAWPEDHPAGQFERYFKGVWYPKWWRKLIGIGVEWPVDIRTYGTTEITGELRVVYGIDNGGQRVCFGVRSRGLFGCEREDLEHSEVSE